MVGMGSCRNRTFLGASRSEVADDRPHASVDQHMLGLGELVGQFLRCSNQQRIIHS